MLNVSIVDGVVYDVTDADPNVVFGKGYAASFIKAPNGVQRGWTWDGETFSPPTVNLEAVANQARQHRDDLLAASDWTQVADAPVDQAAWAAYRQALRDVPQQAGFPDNVIWPEQPV